jgi:FxsC-like protein
MVAVIAPLSPTTTGLDGLYFYLSRAHDDRDQNQDDPDYWVNRVFRDLCEAVERDRRAQPAWRAGYLDPCENGTAGSTGQADKALTVAEVFVALYSVRYLNDVRPMTEQTRFRSRFPLGRPELADPHVLPVLWEPTVEPSRVPEFRRAIELVPDLREYADLGLFGLNRVAAYRDSYERLLAMLSRWIVDVAEGSPVARWPGGGAESAADDPRAANPFVVAVLAPRRGEARGRRGDVYGPDPVDWRPYRPTQPMPVARHAAVRSPAQQFARVVNYDPDVDQFVDSPGVLLVDPWILVLPNGRTRLIQALDKLPSWALPVVLADQNDPQYLERGIQLVDDATGLCNVRHRPAHERRDMRNVDAFDAIIPYWVHLAYRRFRDRPMHRPERSFGRRPRLGLTPADEEGGGDD